ncbi:MAG TPA: maleylpyruvate isomerase N-terminal domain-containing protein [Candidatus Dormibacteraeota bacterium]|nr:maleylpyruvate isomerase N-terminal domain-containing protein [Candidatus Dormibacteraeota bacterium]
MGEAPDRFGALGGFRPGWVPDRAELLRGLARTAEELRRACARIQGPAWEGGRYEAGWNARQILAHLASIEWTYPRLIDLAREVRAGRGEGKAVTREGIDAYNARQVERRASASVDELLAEFERNRSATIRSVEEVEDELWKVEVRSAAGLEGPLARVFWLTAVEHVRLHTEDLAGRSAG